MADINTGNPTRFEQGGVLTIIDGSDGEHTVLWIVAGSLSIQEGSTSDIVLRDRGTNLSVKAGDEQVSTISFSVSDADFESLLDELRPAAVAGMKTDFAVLIELAPGKGETATKEIYFDKCYLQGQPQFQAASDDNPDRWSINLMSLQPEIDWAAPA